MSKPALVNINSALMSWDSDLNDNIAVLRDGPMPIKEYASPGSLPAANTKDRCIAMVDHAELGWVPVYSDGTKWNVIAPIMPLNWGRIGPAGPQTALALNYAGGVASAALSGSVPFAGIAYAWSAVFWHNDAGGGPFSNWTLTLTNVDTTSTATGSVSVNSAQATELGSDGVLSTALAFSKGDRISAAFAGSSIEFPAATASIAFAAFVPEVVV